jgi:hypothetical protein
MTLLLFLILAETPMETFRQKALADSTAWNLLESLTTEVGPRLAGSPADGAATAWALGKMGELAFDRVWREEVTIPLWQRGEARAAITSPFPQPLIVTALGFSPGTPAGGLEAEVVELADLAALEAAEPENLKGRIAFINRTMERLRDGSGYGPAVAARGKGAEIAAAKGAIAFLLRSVGTDSHRLPHTGMQQLSPDRPAIPAAALSVPDAEQLARALQRGPVRLSLFLGCQVLGEATTYNVLGEITGREAGLVLLGAHLDSWDLGTGAVDDGAGVAIVMAAASLVAKNGRPKNTVRVVLFAAEEIGIFGGRAYAEAHARELPHHLVAAESDFGAGRIYRFDSALPNSATAAMEAIAAALAPLGIERGGKAQGGPDLGPMAARGVPVVTLAQDGLDYFDLHHTANDTLDKVDPKALAQNVAAYAVFTALAAEAL